MKSFTVRTTVWFATLSTATIIVVLSVGGWLLDRQMVSGLQLLHELEADELGGLLGPESALTSEQIRDRIERDADSDAEIFYIQVHDGSGAVRFRSDNLGEAIMPDLTYQEPYRTMVLPEVGSVRISEFVRSGWHLQVASNLAPTRRVLRDYARVAGLLVLGSAVASVFLGWGFSRLTLNPLRGIERTARRIGGDNLGERIPIPPGRDELAALCRLLNETFDRIEAAFAQVKQFTADASHELKTPLALIRLNAEKLRNRVEDDPESAGAVDEVLEEIQRLNQIIESLLFLSKAESGLLTVQRQPLPMPAWLQDWAEDATILAEDRGCRFKLEIEATGDFLGVSNLLRQLLFNLLTNALKVSPPGGLLTLRATREATSWQWVFADEGPGLPEVQLKRIFDRFVRYDPTSGRNRGTGHGLGLAICKSIVDLHTGTIRARNRTDHTGLEIVVEFPDLAPKSPGLGGLMIKETLTPWG